MLSYRKPHNEYDEDGEKNNVLVLAQTFLSCLQGKTNEEEADCAGPHTGYLEEGIQCTLV